MSREGREESEEILNSKPTSLNEEEIGKVILDSAFKVHTTLGPGLLESVYEAALAIELTNRGLFVERQKPISVSYEGQLLEVAFRADLIVNQLVLVELKSVETVTPLFEKTTMNYLKLIPLRLGFLINFNETHLKNGITRITNGLEGKNFFNQSRDISKIDFRRPSPPSRDI
jgi:GxxExxY protein